jgi:hypothetical protein
MVVLLAGEALSNGRRGGAGVAGVCVCRWIPVFLCPCFFIACERSRSGSMQCGSECLDRAAGEAGDRMF